MIIFGPFISNTALLASEIAELSRDATAFMQRVCVIFA
jgi:hypothetical protein